MLDPLEGSDNADEESIMEEIHIKGPVDSDEETNVEHLSPQTLLETPDHEMHYSVRSPEGGVITYRVLQVNDNNGDGLPQIVSTSSQAFNSQIPQMLTGNVGSQLYVIGNSSDFTSQGSVRAIAPRSSVDQKNNLNGLRKRDERRRATHNEVERRRRDKINNWISKLASIIPETSSGDIKGNQFDGQSKGGILAKACDYIAELNDIRDKHEELVNQNKRLQESLEQFKSKNSSLSAENRELKAVLKKNGILFVPSEVHP